MLFWQLYGIWSKLCFSLYCLQTSDKHPESSPAPLQSWFSFMWLLVVSPHQKKSCRASIFLHPELAPCIVSIQLSSYLWIFIQTTGTLCVKWKRVLWRNVTVVGKWDHFFLFYWPADVTKWTALINQHRSFRNFCIQKYCNYNTGLIMSTCTIHCC